MMNIPDKDGKRKYSDMHSQQLLELANKYFDPSEDPTADNDKHTIIEILAMLADAQIKEKQMEAAWKHFAGRYYHNGQVIMTIMYDKLVAREDEWRAMLPWLPADFLVDMDIDNNGGEIHAYEACLKATSAHYFCEEGLGHIYLPGEIKPVPYNMRMTPEELEDLMVYIDNDQADGFIDQAEFYKTWTVLKKMDKIDEDLF